MAAKADFLTAWGAGTALGGSKARRSRAHPRHPSDRALASKLISRSMVRQCHQPGAGFGLDSVQEEMLL